MEETHARACAASADSESHIRLQGIFPNRCSDETAVIHETIYADAIIEKRQKAVFQFVCFFFLSLRDWTHSQQHPLPKQRQSTPEELTAKKSGFLPNSCRTIKEPNMLFIPLTSLQHDAINSLLWWSTKASDEALN